MREGRRETEDESLALDSSLSTSKKGTGAHLVPFNFGAGNMGSLKRKRITPGRMVNHIGLGVHFALLLLLDYAGVRYILKHHDLKLFLLLAAFNLLIFFSFYFLLIRPDSKTSDE